MGKEEFAMSRCGRTTEAAGMHFPKVGEALGMQIEVEDVVAWGWIQSRNERLVFDVLKPVENATA